VVSSDVGLFGVYGYSAYAPTKFAVRGLAETLRGELKPYGIRVGIAYPSDTETPGFERENQIKPAETVAISASIKPRSADVVGRAIVEAIAKDKLTITADAQSAVLARAIGIVGPVVRASMDATVRKVQRGAGEGQR
jgi:3-dehydrosphinganine reductase